MLKTVVEPTNRRAVLLIAGAALLFIIDPLSAQYAVSGLSESMFTFALVLIGLMIAGRPFRYRWLAVGFVIGLSQAIRLNGFVLLVPAL
ncbi:MAG: hypothetical protein O6649_08140, partial [Gammaproteobacteria bacterium]|nr:hypothetical protein [Gammaproteobacteria bacterium]